VVGGGIGRGPTTNITELLICVVLLFLSSLWLVRPLLLVRRAEKYHAVTSPNGFGSILQKKVSHRRWIDKRGAKAKRAGGSSDGSEERRGAEGAEGGRRTTKGRGEGEARPLGDLL
jgi:hypothetical protein